jgi:hypothetical protein
MNEFTELNEADLGTVVGGTDAEPCAYLSPLQPLIPSTPAIPSTSAY